MELPAQVKRCSICKLEKNIYEFSRDINKKDGLCVPCKQCRAVTGIKYRKDNKNKIILKNQKYAQHTKAHPEFINYPNKWYLNRLISNAKKRNISFNLTYQELLESNHCQNCYFCEIELKFTKLAIQAPGNHNASLDRIDSSKGYEIGNIQWTCVNCNLMKKKFTDEQFIQMCNRIAKKHPR